MKIGDVHLLRNYETEHGEGPGDKFIFFRKGTQTTSALDVDLSKDLKKGATVSYCVMKQAATNSTTGVLATASAVAGASAVVTVMIVAEVNDLANASALFGGTD
jgi:hypothetical protein